MTEALLESKLRLLLGGLKAHFGLTRPRILVTGLNPHAGEAGHLGREEIDVIEPVCARFRAQGEAVTGPLPADTAFTPNRLAEADAVLAMYHDQGLPVLKHAGFGGSGEHHLGPALHPHFRGSRHRLGLGRHRQSRCGQPPRRPGLGRTPQPAVSPARPASLPLLGWFRPLRCVRE